ncbi:hypothetical protein HN011_010852 [Eciton burchellii]|nr:hypothetical protein HN011_010852 [Eciton burchellii]
MEKMSQRYHIQNIPPKNVALTRADVLRQNMFTIRNWKPLSDVWSLKFGDAILCMAAAASGIYINRRFRAKLKLRYYGYLSTTLGLFLTPAVTCYLLQNEFVMHKLLTYEVSCPFCLESKSVLIQNFCGLLLPMLGVPFANFSIAMNSGKFNVPYQSDFRGMYRIISSIYQPLLPRFTVIFTLQALLAGFIVYSQTKSFIYIEYVQHLIEQDRRKKSKVDETS